MNIYEQYVQALQEEKEQWKQENYPDKNWDEQAITDRFVFDGDENISDETVEDKWGRDSEEIKQDIYDHLRDEYITDSNVEILADYVTLNEGDEITVNGEKWTYNGGDWRSESGERNFHLMVYRFPDEKEDENRYIWVNDVGEDFLENVLMINGLESEKYNMKQCFSYAYSPFHNTYCAIGDEYEMLEYCQERFAELFIDQE